MKKLVLLFISAFSAITFNACTDEQETILDKNYYDDIDKVVLTQEELTSISFDNLSEIPEADVFSMVTNFLNIQAGKAETRNASDMNFTIKSKNYLGRKSAPDLTRSTDQKVGGTVPIYELIVENGSEISYAVVSADERAPGVLVLFNGFPTKEAEIHKGLNHPNTKAVFALTKNQLINDIEKTEKVRTELREQTIEKICSNLNIPVSEYSFENIIDKLSVEGATITRNHGGVLVPAEQFIAKKDPMCKILWDQYVPYNRACPESRIMNWITPGWGVMSYGRVPAGCVTIACINIEACLERTSIGGIPMNWSYYKNAQILFESFPNQEIKTPILELERAGRAIRYIYDQLNSFSQTKNGLDENGNIVKYTYATASYYSTNYITNNFNYTNSQLFNPDVVLASLNRNRPVYVTGSVYGDSPDRPGLNTWEGHAFVIDGYLITKKATATSMLQIVPQETRANIVLYNDMYWHVNLGWGNGNGKNSSAYFKLDSDATCTPELDDQFGRYNLVPLKDMQIISEISKK